MQNFHPKLKPIILFSFGLVALVAGLARPAKAGQWQITYEITPGSQATTLYKGPPSSISDKPADWLTIVKPGAAETPNGLFGYAATSDHEGSGGSYIGPYKGSTAAVLTTFNVVFTWTHDTLHDNSSDPPPDTLVFKENASATVYYDAVNTNGTYPQSLAEFGGATPTVVDGLGDTAVAVSNDNDEDGVFITEAQGEHFTQVDTGGRTVVKQSRTVHLKGDIGGHQDCFTGNEAYYTYQAQPVNVAINASIAHGAFSVVRPDYQEWTAYLKQDYKLNDNGDALAPFWSGAGSYAVIATKQDWTDIFSNQQYEWTVDGAGQPYIPSPYTTDEALTYLPAGSTSSKNFNLDFGQSNDDFPKDSTVTAYVTGDNTTKVGSLKVVVHWYLPRWFVTKPAPATPPTPVTTVTGPHDPDKPTGPADPTDDPDAPEMETINLYLQKRKDFVHTGAKDVKLGLEAYNTVAGIYAFGPIDELGGMAADVAVEKAAELLTDTAEVRGIAEEAASVSAETTQLAAEGRQAGKSAEEVTEAEQTAADANQLGQTASQFPADAEASAQTVKTVGNLLKSLPPGVKEKATSAFGDNSLLAAMTPEEREAAASVYEQVAEITTGTNQEAGRLYNLERAKFLRGEVDHLAPTLPAFKIEMGLT